MSKDDRRSQTPDEAIDAISPATFMQIGSMPPTERAAWMIRSVERFLGREATPAEILAGANEHTAIAEALVQLSRERMEAAARADRGPAN